MSLYHGDSICGVDVPSRDFVHDGGFLRECLASGPELSIVPWRFGWGQLSQVGKAAFHEAPLVRFLGNGLLPIQVPSQSLS